MSVFPDFLFLSQPTHIHPLYSEWIHHSHFRKANDPFWLPKLPAPAAAWIPKITGAWNNCSLHGQKMSNEKEVGRDKSSFFSPLNTGQQLSSSSKMGHSHTSLQFHPPAAPSHITFYFVFRVSPISSVNFTNLTESNCPIPKHFFLPMKTLQRYTSVHKKLIQLHNNHFLDIIFETSIS